MIAERVRRAVIIPFCDKHQVYFECGLGEYAFKDADDWEKQVDAEQGWATNKRPTDKAPEGYQAVFEALNTEVPDNMGYNLSLFIRSYNPQ